MSKHSKWAKIKRQKGSADVKKGNVFTKLGNAIAIAAKSGDDPSTNFKLRLAIDKARSVNMPNDTIERAIARGAGKLEGHIIDEALYEVFGPAGVAVMIEATTDNKNRTVNDIKQLLQEHGGRLGGPASVAWLFHRKGTIVIPKNGYGQDVELSLIDAGAEDIQTNDDITITTLPEQLEVVRRVCVERGLTPDEVTLAWLPKESVNVPDDKKELVQKFFEALDNLDDVQEWYTNVDIETM